MGTSMHTYAVFAFIYGVAVQLLSAGTVANELSIIVIVCSFTHERRRLTSWTYGTFHDTCTMLHNSCVHKIFLATISLTRFFELLLPIRMLKRAHSPYGLGLCTVYSC